jgi:wyosine [tRNA(Phe)-imidazoG37] synthetase (radical SAM superfamily)
MKHVYGPVPSRRLGQSLGVDPVPFKTCNWNCLYCQLGRTRPMTNERWDYVPCSEVVDQVKNALARHRVGEIDWITFVGSGEPTLNAGLGRMIREVKALCDLPVAVITNGALLYRPGIRRELQVADAVLPSLDAGSAELYRTINRPWPELTFERVVDGLVLFRASYPGKLWIEVMLIRALNDTEGALRDLAAVLRRIGPDEIHVNLPIRIPAEPWVEPPDREGLMRASALLGDVARIIHPAEGTFDLSGHENVTDAVIEVITRHPMREDELVRALRRRTGGHVARALAELADDGRARVIMRHGHRFWTRTQAAYAKPERQASGC